MSKQREQYQVRQRTEYPSIYKRYARYGGRFVVVWYDGRQRNRTFKTMDEAIRFQRENTHELALRRARRRWGKDAELPKNVLVSHTYESIRKLARQIDAAMEQATPAEYRCLSDALAAVYEAEDEIRKALGDSYAIRDENRTLRAVS